ncbi:MAG: M15 family metallopeptidase [Saccharospirillum sp.]
MSRDTSPEHLHPAFRAKASSVLDSLAEEGLPFRIFEGYRSPQRQRYLYAQGRTRAGAIVTKAKPWQSYHQYGVAADFVLYENGRWCWDDRGKRRKWWQRLHEIAWEHGLEPLSWELPHLQLKNLSLADLQAGHYPKDGDLHWAEHLEAAILDWQDPGVVPPVPTIVDERPPLPD